MREKLKKIIFENKNGYIQLLKNDGELLDWINSESDRIILETIKEEGSEIDFSDINFLTRVYWVLNDYKTVPKCPICGKVKNKQNIIGVTRGYSRACSRKCSNIDPEKAEHYKATCLKKFGSDNFLSSKAGKTAKKEWCEKHGVTNPFQLDWVNEKSKQTRKNRFGYEYTMQSPEKRELAKQNYKTKTGYEHQFYDPAVKDKIREKMKLNVESGIDMKLKFKRRARIRRYRKLMENKEVIPLFSQADFEKLDVKTQYTTPLKWKCKQCGREFESFLDANFSSRFEIPCRCTTCHPFANAGSSKEERDMIDFIKTLSDDVTEHNMEILNPLELDVFIKSRRLGVEYDGLYWHSEDGGKNKLYHLNKTEMCEKQNIQLIHVFEDEWLFKKEIVESRLKNLLGIFDKTEYARKCTVREISSKESAEFVEENHIQGWCASKVNVGLFDSGDNLISVMTFGKPRFNRKYEWELLRFCNKLGYHIPGAAGKLLKYFERNYNPKTLISYADRRWSIGKLYKSMGFELNSVSEPAYFYTRGQKRYSRMMFQKYKLKDKFDNYDDAKSEKQIMQENNYFRIWDCGNLVFVKKYGII